MHATFISSAADVASLIDALVADGFELSPPETATLAVHDTFDGALHASGLRLCARTPAPATRRADGPTLTLDDDTDAPPAEITATAAPRFATDLPPGPFRNRMVAATRGRALLPSVVVVTDHRRAVGRDRRSKVTVTVDVHGNAEARLPGADGPGAALAPMIVEVRGTLGHADAYERAVDRIAGLHLEAAPLDLLATAAQRLGVDPNGRERSPTVVMAPGEPAFDAYRRVLANLAATVAANRQGSIEDLDIEFLHELRVAVRRTRSVLSQAKGVLPDDVRDHYREVFGWLGTETGPARDLDVYVDEWEAYVAPVSSDAREALIVVRDLLEQRRRQAYVVLARALRSRRYLDSLGAWDTWLADPASVTGPKGPDPVGSVVAARIAKAQKGLLRDGRSITPASPAERLHDLRKDAKKLRYLLECFGGLLEPKARKAFVKRLKALQDNLGAHQDAEVHIDELRQVAGELQADGCDARTLLAMGQLTAHLEQRRVDERNRFAEQFAAYDTDATAAALDGLLEHLRGPA